jgi:hypothetical protein
MAKKILTLTAILFICIFNLGYSQNSKQDNLSSLTKEAEDLGIKRVEVERLYGTDKVEKMYDPLPIVLRLSYENFKNIKLLYSAIINYGGGEDEFDKLVEEYAEASGLYFRSDFVESAVKFMINEKRILQIATRMANKYKEETNKIHNDVIKVKTKTAVKMYMSKKNISLHPQVESAISEASYTFTKGNDYLVRSKPVDSIFYYRRAKDRYFSVYTIIELQYKDLARVAARPGDIKYFDRESEKYSIPERYNKDVVDNQNRIYESSDSEKREKDN